MLPYKAQLRIVCKQYFEFVRRGKPEAVGIFVAIPRISPTRAAAAAAITGDCSGGRASSSAAFQVDAEIEKSLVKKRRLFSRAHPPQREKVEGRLSRHPYANRSGAKVAMAL